MKQEYYICDECGVKHETDEPQITLEGYWSSGKSGILLPRNEYHFDKKECLVKWLERATLNVNMRGL